MPSQQTRSPISRSPRRDAGQSLREQREKVVDDLVPWFAGAFLTVALATNEWIRWKLGTPPQPIFYTLIAFGLVWITSRKVRTSWQQLKNLKLGLEGERSIGQFLQDNLIPKGFQVFHDVIDERGNIDHVAIGPAGVFAIETKTVSKPARGKTEIAFNGSSITINGVSPFRDPIIQARACAKSLNRILYEYAGFSVFVRSVVLYPGWFVAEPAVPADVWVLNPERFLGYVRAEPSTIEPEKVVVLSKALERYVNDRST